MNNLIEVNGKIIINPSKTNDTILMPHNQKAYNEATEFLNKYGKVAVIQPTGTGKSAVLGSIIDDHKDENIVLIAPTHSILKQFEKHKVGLGGTGKITPLTYAGILSGFKSNFKSLEHLKNNVKLLVLDELHRSGAEEWGPAMNAFINFCGSEVKIIGASATPTRYDGKDPVSMFCDGNSAGNLPFKEAFTSNILNMPEYVSFPYNKNEELFKMYCRIGNSKICSKNEKDDISKRLLKLSQEKEKQNFKEVLDIHLKNKIDEKFKNGEGSKILIFCEDRKDIEIQRNKLGKELESSLKGYNIISGEYGSHTSKEDFNEFSKNIKKGDVNILYTIEMFNEGLHVEGVDTAIMTRKTKRSSIYYQQAGRVLKVNSDDKPLILDLANNFDNVNCDWNDIEKSVNKSNKTKNKYFNNYSEKYLKEIKDINLDIKEANGAFIGIYKNKRYELKDLIEKNKIPEHFRPIIEDKMLHGKTMEEAINSIYK